MTKSIEQISSEEHKDRLWVISEPFYPDENTTAFHMTKFAEGLAEAFDVRVLCGQPSYSSRGIVAPPKEHYKGMTIYRAKGTTLNKDNLFFRLINMLTLGVSMLFRAVFAIKKEDRILVVTAPPTLQFIVAVAALIKGASYTLLMYDVFPEVISAAVQKDNRSFYFRTIDYMYRWLFKYANKIVVIGRDMKLLIEKKAANLDIPIVIIPNCAEIESITPAAKEGNKLLKKYSIEDKFVILYSGNMGRTHDLESIVEAAEILQNEKDIHFLFVGDGAKLNWLKTKDKELANISVEGLMPRGDQQIFLNACDVSIISLVPSMNGVSVPSRTYNVMAAGKPIIAISEEGSELTMILDEEGIGWRIDPKQPELLAAKIKDIHNIRTDLLEMGIKARKAALEKYTFQHSIQKYINVMK